MACSAGAPVVHLHASHSAPGDDRCGCVCGVPCGGRATTAYRGLDPERVTCAACIAGAAGGAWGGAW